MLHLNDREWKEYFIAGDKGIFTIKATKSGIDKNKLMSDTAEDIPYITRSEANNGVSMFVSKKQNDKYKLDNGNVITIGLDTQTVFYQPYDFFTGQNIQVLEYPNINKYSALFICSMLKVQMEKFNWGGNGATLGRLNRTKIMLPADKYGNPDYDFMEQYIKERETMLLQNYQKIINKNIQAEKEADLKETSWKEFYIISKELFYVDPVRTFKNTSELDGTGIYDVVGATSKHNGNVGFLSEKYQDLLCKKNCICLIKTGQGSVGDAIYKGNDFIPSNNVCVIRSTWLNKYNGLFVVTQINKQADRYSYGYIRNNKRIAREKLMLPSDEHGNPDYMYMEQYGRKIMMQKYQEYQEYISCKRK